MTELPDLHPGQRIRLTSMGEDPDPMPPGATGTIDSIVPMGAGADGQPYLHLNMSWDPWVDRSLNLCVPPDQVEVLPTVEVLHVRDPDSSCDVRVWVNGIAVNVTYYEDIDPGAGYSLEDWDDQTAYIRTLTFPVLSEPFLREILEARDAARDSRYIERPLSAYLPDEEDLPDE